MYIQPNRATASTAGLESIMEKQMFELKLLIFRRWIKNEIFPEAFTRHRARRALSSLSRFRREIINLILFIHVNIG